MSALQTLASGFYPRFPYRGRVPHYTTAQGLVAILLAGAAGTWVYFHAERNRIKHPSAWASFVFLLLIVGLPAYLIYVRRVRQQRGQ